MKFVELTMNTDYVFEIHKAGCKDIAKKARDAAGPPMTREADDVDALVAKTVKQLNEEMECEDWDAGAFNILPCCRK